MRLRDAWCFFGSGVVSLLFFTFCYFQAMNYMSLSAAAILLYTAPAIVTLLSALLFKERLTGLKLLAVLLAFLGCALVSGLGAGDMALSTAGILYGLGAGVVTCYLPYLLYTHGLTGMETGRASIMASVEPVVATIVGAAVFHERMGLLSYCGVVLVLSAVVLLNAGPKRRV